MVFSRPGRVPLPCRAAFLALLLVPAVLGRARPQDAADQPQSGTVHPAVNRRQRRQATMTARVRPMAEDHFHPRLGKRFAKHVCSIEPDDGSPSFSAVSYRGVCVCVIGSHASCVHHDGI